MFFGLVWFLVWFSHRKCSQKYRTNNFLKIKAIVFPFEISSKRKIYIPSSYSCSCYFFPFFTHFSQDLMCDGKPDCKDGSDEIEHCHCYQLGEASCRSTGRCINRQKVNCMIINNHVLKEIGEAAMGGGARSALFGV